MATREVSPGSQSVLKLRVWMSERLFGLAPAWALLAGALSTGGLHWRREEILLLVGSVLLVDGLWGQLWTQLAGQTTEPSDSVEGQAGLVAPLPYAAPGSPLSNLWRWLVGSRGEKVGRQPAAGWRALLLSCLLTSGVALLLGPIAVLLSAMAALLAAAARFIPHRTFAHRLAQGLFEMGLPWLLAHLVFGGLLQPGWPLLIAVDYVLLHAGALSLRSRRGLWLINLAQFVPLVSLITARQPFLSTAFSITVLAPLSWQAWLGRADGGGLSLGRYREVAQIWWWAGMLVTAWGIGR